MMYRMHATNMLNSCLFSIFCSIKFAVRGPFNERAYYDDHLHPSSY